MSAENGRLVGTLVYPAGGGDATYVPAPKEPSRIKYRSGYKYKLAEDCVFDTGLALDKPINTTYVDLGTNGVMVIRAGYGWDGATGVPDGNDLIRGSLIHDALYQLIREGHLPKTLRDAADRILQRVCMEDGMSPKFAEFVYQGVRILGNTAADPSDKDILLAPPIVIQVEAVFPSKEAP